MFRRRSEARETEHSADLVRRSGVNRTGMRTAKISVLGDTPDAKA